MEETSELKVNGLYYENFKQRLVFIDEVGDDVVVASDYHSSERLEYDREELEAKHEVGGFFLVDAAEDREDHEDDDVAELMRYEEICKRLADVERVDAKVERDKTFSPNLKVTARSGYGAPSSVFSILLGEFENDEVLAVEPFETSTGDAAIMYRCKDGGY